MKFSENWLRELVEIPLDRDALVQRFNMSGHEVEELVALPALSDDIVVGEIIEIAAHPDADRLRICQVAAGQAEPLTIVCGAPNARLGLKAPLAMIGAELPGGMRIKPAKLRGVESFGMLCSARELGVDADAAGLMELPAEAAPGQPLNGLLGLPDAAIELGLTPNRPDCLGMLGLAADVAAIVGTQAVPQATAELVEAGSASRGVRLQAGSDCPRYLGRVIEGINASAPTPAWMASRLRRAGLRPKSVVVDVTNYVMLELGQPLHAFDNDRLAGDVVVRHAADGEQIALLDGGEATLEPGFLVIADDNGPLAVAGVMGGAASAVGDATCTVFLESAHFAPPAIMGRARKLGRHTDASHRFERGVDPDMPRRALDRASALLLELAGGTAGPAVVAEQAEDLPRRTAAPLRRARLARLLGIAVPDAEVERILRALDMRFESTAEGWLVTPPSRRFDIAREVDLIEEIARIHGYERIPVRPPSGELVVAADPEQRLATLDLAEQLVARDYQEAINMAFVPARLLEDWSLAAEAVALANPLSAELAVMRSALLPGLVETLQYNRDRQQERVRLFETGRRFALAAKAEAPRETMALAMVVTGAAAEPQWGIPARPVDFHDLKGDVESLLAMGAERERWSFDSDELPPWLHPGRGARLLHDGRTAGFLGALHPALASKLGIEDEVLVAEIELDVLSARRLPVARPVSRQPAIRRDIAVEVDQSVPWADMERTLRQAAPDLKEIRLFDLYSGESVGKGRKSLAISLILQDESRTLVDEDADRCVALATRALEREHGARLRG